MRISRIAREKRKIKRKAAIKRCSSVLVPVALGCASGLAFICGLLFDPYRPPPYEEPMIRAQGGEYYYKASEYQDYLDEKAAYKEMEKNDTPQIKSSDSKATDSKQKPSEGDSYLLRKIAMAEAEGEDTEGKALVMLTVLNRVNDEKFPDSIEGVITELNAFTSYWDGRYDSVEPDADCLKALRLIVDKQWDESQGATYFEVNPDGDTWHSRNLQKLFTHGNHTFYKEMEE